MATTTEHTKLPITVPAGTALWDLGVTEITSRNLEASGREIVNELLAEGWVLLSIYTLKYQDDGVWRERPMAILGLPAEVAKH